MKKFKKLTTTMLIALFAVCGAFGVSSMATNVAAAYNSDYSSSSSVEEECTHVAPKNVEDYIFYQEASCFVDGYEIYICTECYEVVENVIDADHTWTMSTTATCDQGGMTTWTCDDCGDINQYYQDPLGHDKSNPATCDEAAYCNRCDQYFCVDPWDTDEDGNVYVDVVFHDLRVEEAQQATCVEDGWTEYVYCENCDYETPYIEIEAFGHSFKRLSAPKLTCMGLLEATHYCTAVDCHTYAIIEDGEYVEYYMFDSDIYDEDIVSIGHTIEYDGGCTCGIYWEDDLPEDVYYVDGVVYETYSDYVSCLDELVLEGETVLKDGESFVLNDFAVLTISGEGSFENAVEGDAALINYGTLTIEGGAFLNENIEAQRSSVIKNYGTLIIDGGTFGSALNRGAAVENYGTLIINGGTFATMDRSHASNGYAYVFINKEGTMTINDATVAGNPNGIFAADGGEINVYGGSYQMGNGAANTWHVAYTWKGIVNIYGGTYDWAQCWNGAAMNSGDVVIYGGEWNKDPSAWLAEGYSVVEMASGKYFVLADETTEKVEDQIVLEEGEDFNGNGATIDASNVESIYDCALTTTGGTVENVTVLGAFRGVGTGSSGTYGLTADLYIDNVTIDGGVYALNVGTGNGYNMYVSNSKLYGWSSYSGLSMADFTNVVFGKGATNYQYVRVYDDSYFYGCTFEEGFEFGVNSDGFENGPLYIELNGCYYGDTLITAENFVALLAIQDRNDEDWIALKECTVVIDGVEVTAEDFEATYIFTAEELVAFGEAVNSGDRYSGKVVKLMADIDLAGAEWAPIGNVESYPGITFAGTFEGNDYTIKNMTTSAMGTYAAAGFFGSISGVVQNLYFENAEVVSEHYAGVVVAYIGGETGRAKVINCHVDGASVTSKTMEVSKGNWDNGDKVGGIVGYLTVNDGVYDCSVSNAKIKGYRDIGGIVGYAHGVVSGNSVINTTLTVDSAHNYKNYTKPEEFDVGEIVGEASNKAIVENNVAYNVEIEQDLATVNGEQHSTLGSALEAIVADQTVQEVTIEVVGGVSWETGASHGSTPLAATGSQEITIDGGAEGATFTATGAGVGPIASKEGTLIFKNLTFVDESVSYAESSWEFGYLEFEGNLKFVNCTFVNAITIDGNAEFIDCTFNSNKANEYDVWVSGGNVFFAGCTFEGYRGLKLHEAYGTDIYSVIVDDCTFGPLSKKPGVAIGDIYAEGETYEGSQNFTYGVTTVVIKNSKFNQCQAGDQGLYIYETDTDVTTFAFTEENNTINN